MANKRVLSVMMPVYNEEPTLETIAGHVLDRPEVAELVAVDDGSTDRSWEILQELGNKAVTLACNVLFDCYISDLETGYKVLRSDLWKRLNLKGSRFDIEPDITARVLRLGYRIHEVPIRYYARSRAEGKKLTWQDGVQALGTLARLRLASDAELFGPEHDKDYHRERQHALAMH